MLGPYVIGCCMSKSPLFENLGTGVGLRSQFFEEFRNQHPSSVNWVEVISENYMRWEKGNLARWPVENLLTVRNELPVGMHGVSMSLGSAEELSPIYLKLLKEVVDLVQPVYVSDHLCWTGLSETNLHDLLPLPYTQEVIEHVARKIEQAQNYLGRRMMIENLSSYVTFKSSEMEEWEFLTEITNLSDCGILLDINNVYVSSVNHNFDPKKYLDNVPHHRVGQIHLAGHAADDGFMIDTHDSDVCPEVWQLFEYYISRYGSRSTMIERDGNIPEWQEMEKEVLMITEKTERASRKKSDEKPIETSAIL